MPSSYKLNPDAEAAIVRQMVADPSVLPKVHRHIRAEGFDAPEARLLVGAALAYYAAYGRAPTKVALMQELRERANAGRVKPVDLMACGDYLLAAQTRAPIDSAYAVKLVLEREVQERVWAALEEGTRLHVAGKGAEEIEKVILRATTIGRVDLEMGVDFASDLDRRTQDRLHKKQPRRWGTGIPSLDDLMDGGISLENPLGCVEGGPKSGKSLFLGHVALYCVALGARVCFFSMENGKEEVLKRMDASVAGIPISQVFQRAAEVQQAVAAWYSTVRGRLHVQKFPQGSTRPKDLEAYLDILAVEFDFRPDVVIFDYPGEMSADDSDAFTKRWEELIDIYRALRAMCERRRFIGWAGAQLGKEGVGKKMASTGDTGGTIGIEQLVDVMVAIGRTAEEVEAGLVRFGVTASRFCRDHVTTEAMPSGYDMGRIVASWLPREM